MFRLPARRFGNRWRLVISTVEPDAPEGWRSVARPVGGRPAGALAAAAQEGLVRGTYRLQLGPDLSFDDARARCRTSAARRLPPLPVAVAAGAARLDARLRRDRPAPDLGGPRRRGRVPRARPAAGLGVLLDIVPNHMATDDANPFWSDAELRERFFDIDPRTRPPPPLLRHRRARRRARGGPRGLRDDPRAGARARRGGAGRRPAHRPPRRARRPGGYLAGCASAASRHVWVEKILEPGEELRDWPVEGTTGYEFLNDATALFVDPAGEAPLTALYAELTGERRAFADLADEAKLEEARTTFQPEVERLRELVDDPGMDDAVAALPVYRTYVDPEGEGADDAGPPRRGGGRPARARPATPWSTRPTPTRRRSSSASSRRPAR